MNLKVSQSYLKAGEVVRRAGIQYVYKLTSAVNRCPNSNVTELVDHTKALVGHTVSSELVNHTQELVNHVKSADVN
jgi:hypothetical protein